MSATPGRSNMLLNDDGTAVTFTKRGHSYRLNGEPVPSVTTNLKDGFPSPALVSWAARETAAAAVDRWDELATLSVSERLEELRRAAWGRRDAAALRGTEIHTLGERIVAGEPVEIPEALVGPVNAYARFLDRFDVQPVLVERPVANVSHGWAGTIDLKALVSRSARWLLDLKTGKGVYESHALQLAAYAHAEIYLDDAGEVQPWEPPDRCGVVHLTADSAELIPVDGGLRAYTIYRHAATVARYRRDVEDARKERRPWPVGRPIDAPETRVEAVG